MAWTRNITETPLGIYRTTNGNADELIAIGRIIKAGFPCSRVDITNSRYDAIIEVVNGKLLRVQIKGSSGRTFDFTGGGRSGAQINRDVPSRSYKYTERDCDLFVGINSNNGDIYIIPINDLSQWGKTKSLSKLQEYRENWEYLKSLVI